MGFVFTLFVLTFLGAALVTGVPYALMTLPVQIFGYWMFYLMLTD